VKETELAAAVMRWLQEQGWDCYPEAQFRSYGGRADIAAVRDGRLWIIECKLSLSTALLDQAHEWIGAAHYVSIAVPSLKRRSSYGGVVDFFLQEKGIGLIRVATRYTGDLDPLETIPPRLHRYAHHRAKKLIKLLHPDMKHYAPGNDNSSFSSPFNRTMKDVAGFVRLHPGCTVKEIVDNVPHHYGSSATARSAIPQWLEHGFEKYQIRVKMDGHRRRFYAVEVKEAILRRKRVEDNRMGSSVGRTEG